MTVEDGGGLTTNGPVEYSLGRDDGKDFIRDPAPVHNGVG